MPITATLFSFVAILQINSSLLKSFLGLFFLIFVIIAHSYWSELMAYCGSDLNLSEK